MTPMTASRARLSLLLLASSFLLGSSLRAEHPKAWTTPIEPFRVVGNIYYVGTEDLGAYLLVGDDGAILLDAPMEENAAMLLRNIEKLGVDPKSIRVLLNSHAHMDHAGALASLQKATGGRVLLSAADAELAARGGRDDFAFGDSMAYPPVVADAIIEDGQVVRVGNVAMTAMITPGHTKGCTTWRTTVVEDRKPLDVVFLCSVSAPGYQLVGNEKYPRIHDDYRSTFERLGKLRPDAFFANHGSFFDLTEKRAKLREGGANPFIGGDELGPLLERFRKQFDAEVEKQTKKK
jgi:metallo-beta-lactamase class B